MLLILLWLVVDSSFIAFTFVISLRIEVHNFEVLIVVFYFFLLVVMTQVAEIIYVNDNGVEVLRIFFIGHYRDVFVWVDNPRLVHFQNLNDFLHYPRPRISLVCTRHLADDQHIVKVVLKVLLG